MSLDVKEGHCYIDRHCYANGEAAPYPGHHCQKCDRYWESVSGGSSRSSSGSSSGSSPATTAHKCDRQVGSFLDEYALSPCI